MFGMLGELAQYITDSPKALQGKVVLITGASSGIGRELSIALHSLSMRVIMAARNTERLEELRKGSFNVFYLFLNISLSCS